MEPTLACLTQHLPKAARARDSALQSMTDQDVSKQYRMQEKLNGVLVLWDGSSLWSKTGRRVSAPSSFHSMLPPSFPLVGELFLGYGYTAQTAAVTLVSNKLPSRRRV